MNRVYIGHELCLVKEKEKQVLPWSATQQTGCKRMPSTESTRQHPSTCSYLCKNTFNITGFVKYKNEDYPALSCKSFLLFRLFYRKSQSSPYITSTYLKTYLLIASCHNIRPAKCNSTSSQLLSRSLSLLVPPKGLLIRIAEPYSKGKRKYAVTKLGRSCAMVMIFLALLGAAAQTTDAELT